MKNIYILLNFRFSWQWRFVLSYSTSWHLL